MPDFLTCLVTNFLCDRRQGVKIESITSIWSHPKTGVPQGTLLGPVVSLLHSNGLQTGCPTVKYLDDSSVWKGVTDLEATVKSRQQETKPPPEQSQITCNSILIRPKR